MDSRIHPISSSKNPSNVIEIKSERINVHTSPRKESNPMIEPTIVPPPQNAYYDQNLQANPYQNTYPQPNQAPYNPTVQISIHPAAQQNQPAQDMSNPEDKPTESKHMATLMAASYNNTNNPDQERTFNLPDQEGHENGQGGKQRVKKIVIMKKGTTCCCGIFTIRLGIIGNLYRLFVAIITLPFTTLAFIFTLICKLFQKCFKSIKKALCKKSINEDDAGVACDFCIQKSYEFGYCAWVCRLCEPDGVVKCCTSASECVANSCDNCSESCTSCCAIMGGGCGKCCGFFGSGICGGLGFFQGLISSCLECGKGLYADCFGNCGSLLAKCCGFGTEYAGKCYDCASGCYGTCMQCQCDWDLCETLKKCLCSCGDIDFSWCSDCFGDCCSGSATQFFECLQGVLCNLVEVLGGVLSSLGKIFGGIYDLVKDSID